MNVLIAYDVATGEKAGRRRLRKIAQICQDYGQRVQYSLFECVVDETVLVQLRHRLLEVLNPEEDSLRIYRLPANLKAELECYGLDRTVDFEGPLII